MTEPIDSGDPESTPYTLGKIIGAALFAVFASMAVGAKQVGGVAAFVVVALASWMGWLLGGWIHRGIDTGDWEVQGGGDGGWDWGGDGGDGGGGDGGGGD